MEYHKSNGHKCQRDQQACSHHSNNVAMDWIEMQLGEQVLYDYFHTPTFRYINLVLLPL